MPLKIAVDSIAGSAPLPGFYRAIVPDLFSRSPTGLMIFTAGVMILIAALDEIQSFAAWLLETYTGERLVLDFRAKLFRHIQRLSLSYHDSKGTADSIYRLSDALHQSIAVNGVMPFISSVLTLLAMIYIIARIDWTLAAVAVAASPLLFWATRASVGELRDSWKKVRQLESSALSVLQEVLASIRVVKAFVREDHEEERFVSRSRARLAELIRVILMQMKFDITISMLIAITSAVTLSLGILRRAGPSRSAAYLLIGYLAQLCAQDDEQEDQPVAVGARRWNAVAVLGECLRSWTAPSAAAQRAAGAIGFRHVSFGYGDGVSIE